MTTAALLTALLTYGPSILPLISKLVADIEAGRGNQTVTAADLAELQRLAAESSADIYARLNIAPPPPAVAATSVATAAAPGVA
jgi:hypothetical protein